MNKILHNDPVLANETVEDYSAEDFVYVQENEKLKDKVYKSTSYLHDVWVNFKKNRGALIGAIIIILITLMAVIGPMISGYKYDEINLDHTSLPPRIQGIENIGIFKGYENGKDIYKQKNAKDYYYWLGTDTSGRDLFTRVCEGTRISLFIALVAVVIDIVIGMSYGLISGYFGGKVDMIMQRFVEVLNGIPTLVMVTLLQMILPSGMISIVFALIITGWIGMSRIARAEVLKLKESEFVLASRSAGASHFAIIFKDILPNIFGQLITMAMFSIPSAIFTEAYLSFVGLGIPAPAASLGTLISDGYKSLTVHPHMIMSAIFVLALLMLCFNLFADGLRDAFDPNQKH